ncbi:hypothetical protein HETIRDRAFT_316994 [Heterobasidion irregulare TC 32-1]|uniref:Uncharacterized protein n=1 Tax=Heterobasidion irregulare (strain TC 32-1) TaxID=747525 RepID=W4K905_HETIT|nr:uncharacterized protein HETIRDRAFT_316994 [Heterobasidion irregulare TC 32-1]ETW81566.1 hypothetical protein HETIRDRAFT_316994 [Heterobasidion irregulare TC 32-1]
MGGNALTHLLPAASFPRLPHHIYAAIKAHLHDRLAPLYERVATPREAPEKLDYGDVDFIVVCPKKPDITHEDVRIALGAGASIQGRTSNFAVPLSRYTDEVMGNTQRGGQREHEEYVQVDVHVCAEVPQFERVVFFHGYGDLGMIIGCLARSVGLHLGDHGLKVSYTRRYIALQSIAGPEYALLWVQINSQDLAPTTSPAFPLSASFDRILMFLGLSLDRWSAGLSTREEAFEWVATSRFYSPVRIRERQLRAKRRVDREMYQAFIQWNEARANRDITHQEQAEPLSDVADEALVYFEKKEEFSRLVKENQRRVRLKQTWNGNVVGGWTGWYGHGVARVMEYVREKLGEDRILEMEESELRAAVMEAKEIVQREWDKNKEEARDTH